MYACRQSIMAWHKHEMFVWDIPDVNDWEQQPFETPLASAISTVNNPPKSRSGVISSTSSTIIVSGTSLWQQSPRCAEPAVSEPHLALLYTRSHNECLSLLALKSPGSSDNAFFPSILPISAGQREGSIYGAEFTEDCAHVAISPLFEFDERIAFVTVSFDDNLVLTSICKPSKASTGKLAVRSTKLTPEDTYVRQQGNKYRRFAFCPMSGRLVYLSNDASPQMMVLDYV